MLRPSPWLMLVAVLIGLLVLREPRLSQAEESFLRWLVKYSQTGEPPVPLTVVEIGADPLTAMQTAPAAAKPGTAPPPAGASGASPLEFALFLQSVLDFQPGVIAFENILKWRERDKDQEQVFLDQAMRVPKLLLASELGESHDPDTPWDEIRGFSQVTGKRGNLAAFSAVSRQPTEDLRLISTVGFVNLPDENSTSVRVPLLFLYRGEVIPSFPLQTILLWLGVTPGEVKIVLGSHILLPQNRRIPINADGTLLIDPNAATRTRRISLNELLLAAQQRDTEGGAKSGLADLQGQIVLTRTPSNPLSPPDLFAATIATIQGNHYLRRVTPFFDCAFLLLVGATAHLLRKVDRVDLLLCGIALTAAYCLIALTTILKWNIWLPGILPLGAIWISILVAFIFREKEDATISIPPPIV